MGSRYIAPMSHSLHVLTTFKVTGLGTPNFGKLRDIVTSVCV